MSVLLVLGSLVCISLLSVLPPQLHLVGGGETRGAEGSRVSQILLFFFHRGSIFKEDGSSLFLAFEVPAGFLCTLQRGSEPQASACVNVSGVRSLSLFQLCAQVSYSSE